MRQHTPLISIIVPVYNVKPYLEKCLASIAAQTYPNKEVILVDDASTDGGGPPLRRVGGLCRVASGGASATEQRDISRQK